MAKRAHQGDPSPEPLKGDGGPENELNPLQEVEQLIDDLDLESKMLEPGSEKMRTVNAIIGTANHVKHYLSSSEANRFDNARRQVENTKPAIEGREGYQDHGPLLERLKYIIHWAENPSEKPGKEQATVGTPPAPMKIVIKNPAPQGAPASPVTQDPAKTSPDLRAAQETQPELEKKEGLVKTYVGILDVCIELAETTLTLFPGDLSSERDRNKLGDALASLLEAKKSANSLTVEQLGEGIQEWQAGLRKLRELYEKLDAESGEVKKEGVPKKQEKKEEAKTPTEKIRKKAKKIEREEVKSEEEIKNDIKSEELEKALNIYSEKVSEEDKIKFKKNKALERESFARKRKLLGVSEPAFCKLLNMGYQVDAIEEVKSWWRKPKTKIIGEDGNPIYFDEQSLENFKSWAETKAKDDAKWEARRRQETIGGELEVEVDVDTVKTEKNDRAKAVLQHNFEEGEGKKYKGKGAVFNEKFEEYIARKAKKAGLEGSRDTFYDLINRGYCLDNVSERWGIQRVLSLGLLNKFKIKRAEGGFEYLSKKEFEDLKKWAKRQAPLDDIYIVSGRKEYVENLKVEQLEQEDQNVEPMPKMKVKRVQPAGGATEPEAKKRPPSAESLLNAKIAQISEELEKTQDPEERKELKKTFDNLQKNYLEKVVAENPGGTRIDLNEEKKRIKKIRNKEDRAAEFDKLRENALSQEKALVEFRLYIERELEFNGEVTPEYLEAKVILFAEKDYFATNEQMEKARELIKSYFEKKEKATQFIKDFKEDKAKAIRRLTGKKAEEITLVDCEKMKISPSGMVVIIETDLEIVNKLHKPHIDKASNKVGGFEGVSPDGFSYVVVESKESIFNRMAQKPDFKEEQRGGAQQEAGKLFNRILRHEKQHAVNSHFNEVLREDILDQKRINKLGEKYKAGLTNEDNRNRSLQIIELSKGKKSPEDAKKELNRENLEKYLTAQERKRLLKTQDEIMASLRDRGEEKLQNKIEELFLGENARYTFLKGGVTKKNQDGSIEMEVRDLISEEIKNADPELYKEVYQQIFIERHNKTVRDAINALYEAVKAKVHSDDYILGYLDHHLLPAWREALRELENSVKEAEPEVKKPPIKIRGKSKKAAEEPVPKEENFGQVRINSNDIVEVPAYPTDAQALEDANQELAAAMSEASPEVALETPEDKVIRQAAQLFAQKEGFRDIDTIRRGFLGDIALRVHNYIENESDEENKKIMQDFEKHLGGMEERGEKIERVKNIFRDELEKFDQRQTTPEVAQPEVATATQETVEEETIINLKDAEREALKVIASKENSRKYSKENLELIKKEMIRLANIEAQKQRRGEANNYRPYLEDTLREMYDKIDKERKFPYSYTQKRWWQLGQ